MFTTYAPRVAAHPTRTGAKRSTAAIRLLVIHTSQGSEGALSAEALARFIATPRTADNLASYNYIADHDRVIPIVSDDHVAYAQAGANHDGLSICYPGLAGQTPAQWADPDSTMQHEQVSRWLADKSAEYGIPLRKLNAQDLRDGLAGVCGHNDVRLAYGKTSHTDPGPHYPWPAVLARAVELARPAPVPQPEQPPMEDVEEMFISHWAPDTSWWMLYDGLNGRQQLTAVEAVQLIAAGVPRRDLPADLLPRTGTGWAGSRPA